jgi:hypothetical protein
VRRLSIYMAHASSSATGKPKSVIENDEIVDAPDKTKMPWLVPACSYDDLKAKVEEAGADLLPGANIAGLVPGVVNASFDAKANLWDANSTQEWAFEFKARTSAYSLNDACMDLEA